MKPSRVLMPDLVMPLSQYAVAVKPASVLCRRTGALAHASIESANGTSVTALFRVEGPMPRTLQRVYHG